MQFGFGAGEASVTEVRLGCTRGRGRGENAGRTLRDHYGIPRPDSQFAIAGANDR
jgi:hypothetical protein